MQKQERGCIRSALKWQVYVVTLLLKKKVKSVTKVPFHQSSRGRKLNKHIYFRDLAEKHSFSARQEDPINLRDTKGASEDTALHR